MSPMVAPAPVWTTPPDPTDGSLDPLGDQAEADAIADALLPGLNVATHRVRYLSFLAWTHLDGLDDFERDRWEAALACGEFQRHGGQPRGTPGRCVYLGIRAAERGEGHGRVPVRATRVPARRIYGSLLESAGILRDGALSGLGEDLAGAFGRDMAGWRTVPKRASGCDGLPCLSRPRARELRLLRAALIEDGPDARARRATLKEIGRAALRRAAADPGALLRNYLRASPRPPTPAGLLARAARHELRSLPLRAAFQHYYATEGAPVPRDWAARRPVPLVIRSEGEGLGVDIAAHARRLADLGEPPMPPRGAALRDEALRRHLRAKPDAPWVDEAWRVLRSGLAPDRAPTVRGYRLAAFAALLRDIGEIR